MVRRPFIRKAINSIFLNFIFETGRHNEIAELLEIFVSIIKWGCLTIERTHFCFCTHPTFTNLKVCLCHQQLLYRITQFVKKDPKLADSGSGLLE